MTDVEQRAAAKHFAQYWKGKGYEKEQSQPFWLSLLGDVFDVEHPAEYISFEDQVHLDHTAFIDGYIPATKVLIEQKSLGKSLTAPIQQSDGSLLSPLQQAQRYVHALLDEKGRGAVPRWVITCNFEEFRVYDMDHPQNEAQVIKLDDLPTEHYRLKFLVDKGNEQLKRELELSLKAGELVGVIHDRFLEQYSDPMAVHTQRSLNILCVRLVFCLYAEDAGLFGAKDAFSRYIGQYEPKDIRRALIDLFKVLDTEPKDRDEYLEDELAAFPYVNGGLFADENIVIPKITESIKQTLMESAQFNWSEISPTIFGAVFESTLNPETRRAGGMHYTSIENIHKVIDPLFLDDLKKELAEIRAIQIPTEKTKKLKLFQKKLAGLTFLDPACGSGNFLTETYVSLRRLENEVLMELHKGQVMIASEETSPILVSISQFYGIEINDFAVTVAKTALWIAESQMMKETEDVVLMPLDFLPLKTNANIVEGNALLIDWNKVVLKEKLCYIMGNPPFVAKTGRTSAEDSHSAAIMSKQQKAEKEQFFGKNAGLLDYVCCWYKKAATFTTGTKIVTAFVATSSICQGQQVEPLWSSLLKDNITINFAYTNFKWESEAEKGAYVFVVIVGFSHMDSCHCALYSGNQCRILKHISPYLTEGDNVLISSRNKPICDVPEIGMGNQPIDGGNYLFKKAEMDEFIKEEPLSAPYFHLWYGADEFINGRPRYCLWLGQCSPAELHRMPHCLKRVENVRSFRLSSSRASTVKLADKPTRFQTENMPKGHFIVIPEVSSGARRYIPMGYMDESVMCSNTVRLMPSATLYHFGILTSNVHMAWMRTVGGYFGPSYRYSINVVYNNYPWPNPTEEQKAKIEKTAQAILDARALYPDSSLADLYDELTMPPELRTAHQNNDRAVMAAYGFWGKLNSESECVAELMRMYQELVERAKG